MEIKMTTFCPKCGNQLIWSGHCPCETTLEELLAARTIEPVQSPKEKEMTDAEKAFNKCRSKTVLNGNMAVYYIPLQQEEKIIAALKAQEKPVEVTISALKDKIFDKAHLNGKRYSYKTICEDYLSEIAHQFPNGLKIIEGGGCRHTGASCLYVGYTPETCTHCPMKSPDNSEVKE